MKDGLSMKKIMTFFSKNIGSFVLTFGVIYALFSLKQQFGIQDTIATTIIVAIIAIVVSEVTRNLCKKALLGQEEARKQVIMTEIENNKTNNNKAK